MKEALKLVAVIAIVVGSAFAFVSLREGKGYGLRPGSEAPAFRFRALPGGTVDLASFRGKVVLVNFWATWCPPCVEEMPSLERLHRALGPEGLVVLGVAADDSDDDVRTFLPKVGVTFPVLRDPGGRVASTSYRATGFPETFLIGRDGRIVKIFIGPAEWDTPEALAYFRGVLGGRGPVRSTSPTT
jgi:peroxiredoxin